MKKPAAFSAVKFEAGKQTAVYDATHGGTHEPVKTDDPSWAAGYRSACADFAANLGPNWAEKMLAA